MNLIGSLLKSSFGFFTSKRRALLLVSFFVFCGIFLVVHHTYATTLGGVAVSIVGFVAELVVWIVGQCVALVTYVLIAVANYNDFSASTAISIGWIVLRDVANMFFIIIFLVIAFGTLLGEDIAPKYHYKHTLVRFIMMAVLINFSKTIACFVIDIGQVVMMTFVNAFTQAAGGNFLEVLQIRNITTLAPSGEATATVEADMVGGLILAMIVAIISLICMVVLTMILVVRVVALWFLVVVSPLAFFAAAVPMDSIKQFYGKWWGMLVQNVMVGPILAFFIWLSLAVISDTRFTSEMTKTVGGASQEEAQNISQGVRAGPAAIGTPEIMLKYMIGIALLMGGLAMAKQTSAVGASYAGAADQWLRKKGSGAMEEARRVAWAPVRATRGAIRDSARTTSLKGYSSVAGWGVPLVSTWAATKAGKTRSAMQEQESEISGEIKNLNFEETKGYLKSLKRLPVKTEKDKIKINLASKRLLETMKYEECDDEKSKLAQEALKNVFARAKQTNNADLFKFVTDYKNNRLDFVGDKDEVGKIIGTMNDLDINKINDKSFDLETAGGKMVMDALREKYSTNESWANLRKVISTSKRELMDKYAEGLGGYTGQKPETIEDPVKRRRVIENIGSEVNKLDKKSLTPEVVKMMSGQQIEILLKADKISVESLDVAKLQVHRGEVAMKIAEYGSDEVKKSTIEKFGKNYTDVLATNRENNLKIEPVNPNGYSAPVLAASKEILRSGAGAKIAFNVDVAGNFGKDERGSQDMVSFENAFRKEKGGDPLLMLSLKREEFEGEVLEIVRETANDKNVLRQLASTARTDEQKDILEQIIKEVHKDAVNRKDDDMKIFIERTKGIRKLFKAKD